MAYLSALNLLCDGACHRMASVELRTERNETIGKYCRRCGDRRLKEIIALEERDHERAHDTGGFTVPKGGRS